MSETETWDFDERSLSIFSMDDGGSPVLLFQPHELCDGDSIPWADMVARTRKAAAAPELLQALRAIEPFAAIDEWMNERERDEVVRLREQARAAILKATGTTPNNKQSEGK